MTQVPNPKAFVYLGELGYVYINPWFCLFFFGLIFCTSEHTYTHTEGGTGGKGRHAFVGGSFVVVVVLRDGDFAPHPPSAKDDKEEP